MKKCEFNLCGIELAVFVIIIALCVFVYGEFSNQLPQWRATFNSTSDARELASALSTPPSHVQDPFWQRLYHWQTLIAGFLGFLGAATAVVAAWIGARAVIRATEHQVRAEQERDERRREDLRAGLIYKLLEDTLYIHRLLRDAQSLIDYHKSAYNQASDPNEEREATAALCRAVPKPPNSYDLTPSDFATLGRKEAAQVRNLSRRLEEASVWINAIHESHVEYDAFRVNDFDNFGDIMRITEKFAYDLLVDFRDKLGLAGIEDYTPELE